MVDLDEGSGTTNGRMLFATGYRKLLLSTEICLALQDDEEDGQVKQLKGGRP
jgi:hypothetical protein